MPAISPDRKGLSPMRQLSRIACWFAALALASPALAQVQIPQVRARTAQPTFAVNPSSGKVAALADGSVPINISVAGAVELVPASPGATIYVSHFNVIAAGLNTFGLVYGTGVNCGTGQGPLSGAYSLTAQAGIAAGNGFGAILVVPEGNALCALTTSAVNMAGFVAYTKF